MKDEMKEGRNKILYKRDENITGWITCMHLERPSQQDRQCTETCLHTLQADRLLPICVAEETAAPDHTTHKIQPNACPHLLYTCLIRTSCER